MTTWEQGQGHTLSSAHAHLGSRTVSLPSVLFLSSLAFCWQYTLLLLCVQETAEDLHTQSVQDLKDATKKRADLNSQKQEAGQQSYVMHIAPQRCS